MQQSEIDTELVEKYHSLIKARDDLIAELKQVNQEHLNKAPQEGKWSALQILDHIYLAEKKILEEVVSCINSKQLTKRDPLNPLKNLIVNFLFILPIKVKVPVKTVLPRKDTSFDSLISDWQALDKRLKSQVESCPKKFREFIAFKHPILGTYTAFDAIAFLIQHFKRHREQINKAIHSSSSLI